MGVAGTDEDGMGQITETQVVEVGALAGDEAGVLSPARSVANDGKVRVTGDGAVYHVWFLAFLAADVRAWGRAPQARLAAGFRCAYPQYEPTSPGEGNQHAHRRRDRRYPQARGDDHAVLLPHYIDHRKCGCRRHPPGHLPAGTGRCRYGRWLRPRHERQTARRVRDAVRPGIGECVSRHSNHVLGFRAGAVPAAGAGARSVADLPDIPLRCYLRLHPQAGGGDPHAGLDHGCDAPSLCRAEEWANGAGDGGSAAGHRE